MGIGAKLGAIYRRDRHISRLILMMIVWAAFMAITRFDKFYTLINFQTMASQFPEFGLKEKAMGTDTGIFPVKTKTGIDVMSLNLLLENDSDPVVWRGPVIAGAVGQFWTDVIWGDKDVLFIDMPPGTGDVMLTVFQTIPVDSVVLVSTPQELVEMIVEKALKMAGMMEIPVMALVENMSYVQCPDCGTHVELFGKSHAEEIAQRYNIPLTAKLPIDPKLAGGIDKGMIELFNGAWLDEVANAIVDLAPKGRA